MIVTLCWAGGSAMQRIEDQQETMYYIRVDQTNNIICLVDGWQVDVLVTISLKECAIPMQLVT